MSEHGPLRSTEISHSPPKDMGCSCGRIAIGMNLTELRNWNPDCKEHGRDSEWWNSPEQMEARRVQNERVRDMQQKAREAREARDRARARAADSDD